MKRVFYWSAIIFVMFQFGCSIYGKTTNPHGNPQEGGLETGVEERWTRSLVGATISFLKVDKKGNTYIAGTFQKELKGPSFQLTGDGENDIVFVLKFDSRGKLLWSQTLQEKLYHKSEVLTKGIMQAYLSEKRGLVLLYLTTVRGRDLADYHLHLKQVSPQGKVSWDTQFPPTEPLQQNGRFVVTEKDEVLFVKVVPGKETSQKAISLLLIDEKGNSKESQRYSLAGHLTLERCWQSSSGELYISGMAQNDIRLLGQKKGNSDLDDLKTVRFLLKVGEDKKPIWMKTFSAKNRVPNISFRSSQDGGVFLVIDSVEDTYVGSERISQKDNTVKWSLVKLSSDAKISWKQSVVSVGKYIAGFQKRILLHATKDNKYLAMFSTNGDFTVGDKVYQQEQYGFVALQFNNAGELLEAKAYQAKDNLWLGSSFLDQQGNWFFSFQEGAWGKVFKLEGIKKQTTIQSYQYEGKGLLLDWTTEGKVVSAGTFEKPSFDNQQGHIRF